MSLRPLVVSLRRSPLAVGSPPRVLAQDLQVDLRAGDRWALLGGNGSGKTVTARLLASCLADERQAADAAAGSVEEWHQRAARYAPDKRRATVVSLEADRQLKQDEARTFGESYFDVTHLRATPASFLFPELYPTHASAQALGFEAPRTRLQPLPVRYDADAQHPDLAMLEDASTTGEAGRLLRQFGLLELRHRPIFGMSTGELRKLLLAEALLSPCELLILDEAMDGLDVVSRGELRDELRSSLEGRMRDVVLLSATHHEEDLAPSPTHALIFEGGGAHSSGPWTHMARAVSEYFSSRRGSEACLLPPKRLAVAKVASKGAPVVEFRDLNIRYGSNVVFDRFNWLVRHGEKWAVLGGNGSGKSTLMQLITGENVLGYQQDLWLFGRRKGSGESIWDIREKIGLVSSELQMAYVDFSDQSNRSYARSNTDISAWEVVCSGFYDSVGLYKQVTAGQRSTAERWIQRLGITDIASPLRDGGVRRGPGFFELSNGQQKLVLLCRALVKQPKLLLLDEPSNGLSGSNRLRFLEAVRNIGDEPDIAIIYVTHREDEVTALQFDRTLRLTRGRAADVD